MREEYLQTFNLIFGASEEGNGKRDAENDAQNREKLKSIICVVKMTAWISAVESLQKCDDGVPESENVGELTTGSVLKREIPWDTYLTARLISDKDLQLIRRYDKANRETQNQLLTEVTFFALFCSKRK